MRWRASVTDAQRSALERRFRLSDGHQTEGTTWAYTLADASTANIRAIVQHESVDDTAHVNRRRFRPAFEYDRTRRIVVFAAAIGAAGAALVGARAVLAVLGIPVVVEQPVLIALTAAPPVMLAGAAVVMLVLAGAGYQPMWNERDPANLAEAAVWRDHVMVSKMIGGGSDSNAPVPVSIDGRVTVMTPLEAAVMSRDMETVALLTKMGARADAETRARLARLAEDVGANDVAEFLRVSSPAR